MCEILGFSGRSPRLLNPELREFYSHSVRHPNGWGLAVLDNNECLLSKEPLQATMSLALEKLLAQPIRSAHLLAHIRYATIGRVDVHNCHPFTGFDADGRRWTLVHNGTIFDYDPMNRYSAIQRGQTDSERILLYLLDCINDRRRAVGRPLTAQERFGVVDRMVVRVSGINKLNLLIYDGELLYAHTNFAHSLHYTRTEEGILIATQPVSEADWDAVPFTQLVAFRDGEPAFTGTNHGREYFVDQQQLGIVYSAFAEL